MDTTKNQLVEKIRQRFQQYKDRQHDAFARYVNNMPVQHARDRNTDDMLLDRVKAQQPTKPKSKQFDTTRRMSNPTGDQGNNAPNLNGVFNNNDIMQQTSQKRSYTTFSGGGVNATGEDPLQKISRMSTDKQYSNIQNNNQYNVPNVNPFQQPNDSSKPLTSTTVAKPKATLNSVSNPALSLSNTLLANMQNTSTNASNVLVEGPKKVEVVPKVKTEGSLSSSCSVTVTSNASLINHGNAEQNSNFNQYNSNDPMAEFKNYKLYGEVTNGNINNNTIKKVKVETSVDGDLQMNSNLNMTQNSTQPGQQNWSTSLSDQNLSTLQNGPTNVSKQQNPLENLKHMVPRQIQQNSVQSDLSTQQQQQQQQMNQNRPVNINTMISSAMNQQNPKNVTNVKPAMPVANQVTSPRGMIQSPTNSMQSPPMNNLQQASMNSLSPQISSTNVPMQNNMPPNLPRLSAMPNMRQHLADHINKHQQPMPNMANMNNPYIGNHTGPTTNEKLQEHLLKKREHSRMMAKNQYMSPQHMMSPINNPLSQMNPFQFPNDFQSYNQQGMGMQPQQNSMGGFYSNPYQMDQVAGGQMFPNTAPPGYNQQNRAAGMLRNLMRDRHVSEMYNSTMSNMRPTMDQQTMYNVATKAPPQYPNQGMRTLEQQLILNSNTNMQSGSRLSHFSQPNNGTMGMPGPPGMNAGQMRLRAPMNTMNRYPAPPSLSRSSMGMSGNDNMNLGDNAQFNNFNMAQHNQGMINMNQNNPNFNSNYTSEHLLFLQKKRMAQRQQQLLMQQQQQQQQQQRQNQQSSMMQPQTYTIMNNNPGSGSMPNMNTRMHMSNTMNLNTTTSMFQQPQQLHPQQQQQMLAQQQTNNMVQHSNDITPQPNSMAQQQSNTMQQTNNMVQHPNTMLQQSSMLQDTSNQIVNTTRTLTSDRTNISNVDSNKNLLSSSDQTSQQTVNLNTFSSTTNEQSTDDADLDSLLNDPPEHFDLVKMFS